MVLRLNPDDDGIWVFGTQSSGENDETSILVEGFVQLHFFSGWALPASSVALASLLFLQSTVPSNTSTRDPSLSIPFQARLSKLLACTRTLQAKKSTDLEEQGLFLGENMWTDWILPARFFALGIDFQLERISGILSILSCLSLWEFRSKHPVSRWKNQPRVTGGAPFELQVVLLFAFILGQCLSLGRYSKKSV